jgi:hypothetical protein
MKYHYTLVPRMKTFIVLFILLFSTMAFAQTTTFTGTGNWSNSGNWDNGIPISTTNVIVSSGTLTVDGIYECNDLTINSGAVTIISPGKGLTVSGTLTNSAGVAGLIIESDATGSGQLLNNTVGVPATVKQSLVKDQWHYMGIPVTFVPDVNSVFNDSYVIWIHENNANSSSQTGWEDLSTGDALTKLHGYAVQHNDSNNRTITFSGILNTGLVDTLFASAVQGWNFISNPYPASIDWAEFTEASSSSDHSNPINGWNMNNAIYVWNPGMGSYASYINGASTNGQSRYIPPTQGFFIQVYNIAASISFNDNCKVIQTTENFSSYNPVNDDMPNQSIKLAISEDGLNHDETIIMIDQSATTAYDRKFDAAKLKAVESKLPQLYTVTDGREYSINTLPEFDDQSIIPIRVLLKSNKMQTLSVKETDASLDKPFLYLYDESGKFLADILTESYEFKGRAGDTRSFYLALNKIDSDEIRSLHQTTEKQLTEHENVLVHPLNQGAFKVRQDNPLSK